MQHAFKIHFMQAKKKRKKKVVLFFLSVLYFRFDTAPGEKTTRRVFLYQIRAHLIGIFFPTHAFYFHVPIFFNSFKDTLPECLWWFTSAPLRFAVLFFCPSPLPVRTLLVNLLRDIPDTWPILVVSTWEEPRRDEGDAGDITIDHGDVFGVGVARKGSCCSSGYIDYLFLARVLLLKCVTGSVALLWWCAAASVTVIRVFLSINNI